MSKGFVGFVFNYDRIKLKGLYHTLARFVVFHYIKLGSATLVAAVVVLW